MTVRSLGKVPPQFERMWSGLREHADSNVRDLIKKMDTLSDEKLAKYLIKHKDDPIVKKASEEIVRVVGTEKGDDDDDEQGEDSY